MQRFLRAAQNPDIEYRFTTQIYNKEKNKL